MGRPYKFADGLRRRYGLKVGTILSIIVENTSLRIEHLIHKKVRFVLKGEIRLKFH